MLILRRLQRHIPRNLNKNVYFSTSDSNMEIMKMTTEMQKKILSPLNEKLLGPLDRGDNNDQLTTLPFVFLLGNHSSGKSTFINHVLGRDIQTTGVAPTDDGFTIISPGQEDTDQDGPALVGDPDLGFSGLRHFGPSLIQRTQLKVRSNIGVNFMLVDSPGMIDSPTSHVQRTIQSEIKSQSDISDRGYDFPEVTRWFAERADVILLFFDPDKPGTTGETLSILTESLVGMDHKLHIILNKVDQFRKIHDFARAYGSLCWNLSKVIPRKDLPRIYTMCIPSQKTENGLVTESGLGSTLSDLDSTRADVVEEVMRAPERRVDNMITRLYDSTRLVQMHAIVIEKVRHHYKSEMWKSRILIGTSFLGVSGLTTGALYSGVPPELVVPIGGVPLIGSGVLTWQLRKSLEATRNLLESEDGLSRIFKKEYTRQIAEGDEFVISLWKRVMPQLLVTFSTLGIGNLPKVKPTELKALKNIIDTEIPQLRRAAAPSSKSLAHQIAGIFRGKSS